METQTFKTQMLDLKPTHFYTWSEQGKSDAFPDGDAVFIGKTHHAPQVKQVTLENGGKQIVKLVMCGNAQILFTVHSKLHQ